MAAASQMQHRLLFKLPLDKESTIQVASLSVSVLTRSGDLFHAFLSGRHLKLVRSQVGDMLWMDDTSFLVLDGPTHDLIFYKIERQEAVRSHGGGSAEEGRFVVVMHFAFQFISSIVSEHGLKLSHEDPLQLLKCYRSDKEAHFGVPLDTKEDVGDLCLIAKHKFFIRLKISTDSRTLQMVSCIRVSKSIVAHAGNEMCVLYGPSSHKIFFVSFLEKDFLVVSSLKGILSHRASAKIDSVAISPDFCWIVLVTSDLDVHQIRLEQLEDASTTNKTSVHSALSGHFLEEELQSDLNVRRGSRRANNSMWERELVQVVSKSRARENYTTRGWLFSSNRTKLAPQKSDISGLISWRAPEEFIGFVPTKVRCSETESYVTARHLDGRILLGWKKLSDIEGAWMVFEQECLIAFPYETAYPVMLFYPMSMAVIASSAEAGFQRDVAEAAAPDPWEDLRETEVMELAFNQDIVDKAVDYLQKRYPEREDLRDPDYPLQAARAIAREYLLLRNTSAAEDILKFVSVDVYSEVRLVFYGTKIPEYRKWLLDVLKEVRRLLPFDLELYDYVAQMEAHLPGPISLDAVREWSPDQRQQELLKVAVMTSDLALVDTYPSHMLWELLVSSEDAERLRAWIQGTSDFTARPVDPSFRKRLTLATPEFVELVADEFARHHVFSFEELSNWKTYLLRLLSAFGTDHPFFDEKNHDRLEELPANIRKQFLDFCVEHKLVPVILDLAGEENFNTYIENFEAPPRWLTLLLQFRSSDLEDVDQVGELARNNAALCYGDDVTIDKLIALEEAEVALSLLVLNTNQSFPLTNDISEDDSSKISAGQLESFQKQLSKYSRLKMALFPPFVPSEERLAKSVSVYRLLSANAPYDSRKLFGFQPTNALNTHYRSVEMPSFSSPDLQERFGYKKELDYSYYLKNRRPSFAYWSFVSQITSDNFKEEMMAGRDMAFFLAVFFWHDDTMVASCVSFLEMLGIESLSTRITIEAARRVGVYYTDSGQGEQTVNGIIRDLFVELFKYGSEVAVSLLEDMVSATTHAVKKSGVYPSSWTAAGFWILVNQFCELYSLPLNMEYLKICADDNAWLSFIMFCDLFQYPVNVVMPVLEGFRYDQMRGNLKLILASVKATKGEKAKGVNGEVENHLSRNIRSNLYARIGVMASDKTTSGTSTSDEELRLPDGLARKHVEERSWNLVEVLAAAQKSLHPWRELLAFSVQFNAPLYAMMASSENGVNRLQCLCVILLTGLSEMDVLNFRQELSITGRARVIIDRCLSVGRELDLPKDLKNRVLRHIVCGSFPDFEWTRRHVGRFIEIHQAHQNIRLSAVALSFTYPFALLALVLEVAADVEERCNRKIIATKLKKVTDSMQKGLVTGKNSDDVEDGQWGLEVGLRALAVLLRRVKEENEWEWRKILGLLRDSGVMRFWKSRPNAVEGANAGEVALVDVLAEDIAALSLSTESDASRLLELKSLLRDFQRSVMWKNVAFRMEVWRAIMTRVHVELTEKQSTTEIIEILQTAAQSFDSLVEKCVLYGIMWKLDDTDARLKLAWEAKVTYGLSMARPLEEWLADPLVGAGSPRGELQKEILGLAATSLKDIPQLTNTGDSRDGMLDNMTAYLLKLGNLTLASRISIVFRFLNRDLDAICTALSLAKGLISPANIPVWIVAEGGKPVRKMSMVVSQEDSEALMEDLVVIWLRKIASICNLGKDVVLAILDHYCLTTLLGGEFEDLLRASTTEVMERVLSTPSVERLVLVRRCLVSFKANPMQITAFISDYVRRILVQGLCDPGTNVRSLGELVKPYLSVALDPASLANHLIDAASQLGNGQGAGVAGNKELNLKLSVEMLIAAHHVVSNAASLDGIARLISACKVLGKSLAEAHDMHSLLRLLNGIGRYSEMTFIFHLIKEADQMEMLFSRGVDKDPKLRNAILSYLRKFHAEDSNTFDMLAAAYSMHREIGETFQSIAQDKLMLFKHRQILDTMDTQAELKKIIQLFMDAASNYSRAECFSRTENCIEQARLVALQMVFLPTGIRLLSLNNPSGFVATHKRFAEAFIYAQAYNITEEWGEALYQNYVILQDVRYLQDFQIKYPVTVPLVLDVAKKFKNDPNKPPTAPIYMKKLLRLINDIETTYKLANDLGLNDLAMEILQIDDGAFLRDVMKI